ncbi:MAG: hypothetical protein QOH72_5321 [Solirubrobacteraceae bacterium]|nr:hypothetical protein [Solirubrobacteraceae bacterium]
MLLGSATALAGGRPTASFVFTPAAPAAGQPVLLTATSTPAAPDTPIAASLWDFDGDGVFDALGTSVTTTFATAGRHVVRLTAIDAAGGGAIAELAIPVGPPLPPAPAPSAVVPQAIPAPPPGLMNPFPVVRLQGRLLKRGVRVTRLTVLAPAGARVRAACIGRHRGCPRRTVVRRSRSSRRAVRLRPLERRLQAGAVIQISVSEPAAIGKYTRFRVRRGGAPFRRDMCVPAGGVVATRCPGE